MKRQNGFIATSLLYTFFLAFITLFIGMITIYLQNRVYLNKLEDSSKNAIYIREMKTIINSGSFVDAKISFENSTTTSEVTFDSYADNIFKDGSTEYNPARCEIIYFENNIYYIEGCPTS